MAKLLAQPLAPLVGFATILSALFVGYLAEGHEVSLLFETLTSCFWALLVVYWILADTKQRQSTTCYDFGFFCVIFFPLSIIWHCFRTRGWRGAITFAMLMAICMLPYLVAMIVWTLLYGK